ncbi:MAG TPA: O-antigen ligase family protein [Candidatus Dormibacteraeota bacterium]|nr:O-antigen ligase family protein [Candidatus Dormibacteraeota bacterium]
MSASVARLQRWFLGAGLFALPLAYAFNTYDQYVLPKLLIARVILVGLLILIVASSVIARSLVWKRTPLDLPLLAFLASAALSTVFAVNQNVAVFGIYSRYDGLVTFLTYAGLFWLSVQVLADAGEARVLLRVLLASGYVVAGIAIVQSVHDSLQIGAVYPAFGTLGNANVLGAFLAMVLVLAAGELLDARSMLARVLSMNVLAIVALALLLSFSRSAWFGAAIGSMILLAGNWRVVSRLLPVVVLVVGLLLIAGLVIVAGRTSGGGYGLERAVTVRATEIVNFSGWSRERTQIWSDSLRLIAGRPVIGYGPDTFGLVFPGIESGDWGLGLRGVHQPVDKAHAETLQIAATQGLLGLAAYLFILATFVRAFWRGRQHPAAWAVFGAVVAYQATIQLNFTALAAALPFWIFAAAAMVIWGAVTEPAHPITLPAGRRTSVAGIAVIVGLVAAAIPLAVLPYYADAQLRAAVDADYSGHPGAAGAPADLAHQLAPQESVYAVEVGNLAFERGDWAGARLAYLDAARLGTYNVLVYRNLALADRQLGRLAEGLWAARAAVGLDRFDPANQALLAEFMVAP